ncbi:MAG: hypothetical protein HFE91_11360 [Acutalibacter sp.]|uniref:DpnD/PcfM family protein n=1 Tax=Acutalibacter sp. TaxID=1918636 RepID=UPI002172FF63|nr:DpnD/PcfM family protein [Acutalibacter sp.]MCI9226043.1 hypothetical protein [Acutalibacter sp.]
MKTYEVTITETLQKTVEIEASCHAEAEDLVRTAWENGVHVLDADTFIGVDIKSVLKPRSRDHER